ncbi:MAG: hypothetical protein ACK5Q1_17690 [Limnobacter sp.]
MPNPLSNQVKSLRDLFDNHPAYQPLRELGFTSSSVASISGSSSDQRTFVLVAESLLNNLDLIKGIKDSTSFGAKKIASLLSESSLGVNQAIKGLSQHKDAVLKLTSLGFSRNDLAVMLSGTATNVGQALSSLIEHKKTLLQLKKIGFSTSNLSLILGKSGKEIGAALTGLTQNKHILSQLLKDGFSANDLAMLLSGKGANLGTAIRLLLKNKSDFTGLIKPPQNNTAVTIDLTNDDQSVASSTDYNFPSWVLKEDLVNGDQDSLESIDLDLWIDSFFDTENVSGSDNQNASRKRSANTAFDN